ncbi:MAG: SDR family NAD(P)-dependent oxidoreductase [Chloroflexota bacterium]
MSKERFLVTGAFGCIGAWVVRELVNEGTETAVFDLDTNPHRLKLLLADDQLANLNFIQGDVTDLTAVSHAIQEAKATHIIHLAALQVPACRANPPLGAAINVTGTVNIFEAAKQADLKHVVYASSIAVFGPKEAYPPEPLANDALHLPRTHYGVYKSANEGTARLYHAEHGINSVTLRPYTVYGPARDQGMTSTPTKAMLAAARGEPYHISFGGRCVYNFAQDTARAFIQAARMPYEGAGAFNLPGPVAHMSEIIAAIEMCEPSMKGKLSYESLDLPFPEAVDPAPFESAFPNSDILPLAEGVERTIAMFKDVLANGRLTI